MIYTRILLVLCNGKTSSLSLMIYEVAMKLQPIKHLYLSCLVLSLTALQATTSLANGTEHQFQRATTVFNTPM